MINVITIGDWKEALLLTKGLKRSFDKAVLRSMHEAGKKGVEIVHKHINKQDLGWEKLKNKRWIDYKKKKNWKKIWRATGNLYRSIKYTVDNNTVSIGVPYDAVGTYGSRFEASPTGGVGKQIYNVKKIGQIAKALEEGDSARGIPARPLFTPSFEELIIWHHQHNNPVNYMKDSLKKYFVKRG